MSNTIETLTTIFNEINNKYKLEKDFQSDIFKKLGNCEKEITINNQLFEAYKNSYDFVGYIQNKKNKNEKSKWRVDLRHDNIWMELKTSNDGFYDFSSLPILYDFVKCIFLLFLNYDSKSSENNSQTMMVCFKKNNKNLNCNMTLNHIKIGIDESNKIDIKFNNSSFKVNQETKYNEFKMNISKYLENSQNCILFSSELNDNYDYITILNCMSILFEFLNSIVYEMFDFEKNNNNFLVFEYDNIEKDYIENGKDINFYEFLQEELEKFINKNIDLNYESLENNNEEYEEDNQKNKDRGIEI